MSPHLEQPLVSVIVPLYNGAVHIGDALRSVVSQTYPELEVIVVDDGSQDGGVEAARRVSDTRIHYLYQVNGGTARARNAGVGASTGSYLAFLDQDDLWLPDKLARQMAVFMRDESLELVLGHVWQCAAPDGRLAAESLQYVGRRLGGYLPSTMVARRAAFERVGPFVETHTLTESFDWFVRARERQLKQLMLDEIVAIRRVHDTNKGIVQRHARREYAFVIKAALDRRRNAATSLQDGLE